MHLCFDPGQAPYEAIGHQISLNHVGQKQDMKSAWEDVGLQPPRLGVGSREVGWCVGLRRWVERENGLFGFSVCKKDKKWPWVPWRLRAQ